MTLAELIKIKVLKTTADGDRLQWLENREFFWPGDVIDRFRQNSGATVAVISNNGVEQALKQSGNQGLTGPDPVAAIRELRLYSPAPPASARLPISYQHIPHQCRWTVAALLSRINRLRRNNFPAWPLDLSADALQDLELAVAGNQDMDQRLGCKTTVLLTHDIDNPESFFNLPRFLELEKASGVRSTNFIVPRSWELDYRALDEIAAAGHEIGVHGFNHDNKTPFLPPDRISQRLDEIVPFIRRYRVTGYRSPSLLRTENLLRLLADYFAYDASVPNSGGLFSLHNNGCGSARPFQVGAIREIPLNLPSDAALLFLGYSPDRILALWIELTEIISRSAGTVVVLTHCEKRYSGNEAMLTMYKNYLTHILASGRFEVRTMGIPAAGI